MPPHGQSHGVRVDPVAGGVRPARVGCWLRHWRCRPLVGGTVGAGAADGDADVHSLHGPRDLLPQNQPQDRHRCRAPAGTSTGSAAADAAHLRRVQRQGARGGVPVRYRGRPVGAIQELDGLADGLCPKPGQGQDSPQHELARPAHRNRWSASVRLRTGGGAVCCGGGDRVGVHPAARVRGRLGWRVHEPGRGSQGVGNVGCLDRDRRRPHRCQAEAQDGAGRRRLGRRQTSTAA